MCISEFYFWMRARVSRPRALDQLSEKSNVAFRSFAYVHKDFCHKFFVCRLESIPKIPFSTLVVFIRFVTHATGAVLRLSTFCVFDVLGLGGQCLTFGVSSGSSMVYIWKLELLWMQRHVIYNLDQNRSFQCY